MCHTHPLKATCFSQIQPLHSQEWTVSLRLTQCASKMRTRIQTTLQQISPSRCPTMIKELSHSLLPQLSQTQLLWF
jgi:hypothetical protein